MDEGSFTHIAEAVKPHTDHVYLHLMGEPFLNPKLGRFLEICSEKGLMVNITTNGTLINSMKDVLIASPALRQVNISLSSFEANDNSLDLNEYLDNALGFISEKKQHNFLAAVME